MTQNALLTFLPLYLARQMNFPVLWIGASMFALQAAGLVASAGGRASVRPHGPPAAC